MGTVPGRVAGTEAGRDPHLRGRHLERRRARSGITSARDVAPNDGRADDRARDAAGPRAALTSDYLRRDGRAVAAILVREVVARAEDLVRDPLAGPRAESKALRTF